MEIAAEPGEPQAPHRRERAAAAQRQHPSHALRHGSRSGVRRRRQDLGRLRHLGAQLAPGAAPAVHWTWGLSFPRTSPAHGTAFDIAWKNKADPAGMKAALLFAAKLAAKRKK